MNELELEREGQAWYLIAADGDIMMRVHAGMTLGETSFGELSFVAADALVRLDIDLSGNLIVQALSGGQLRAEGEQKTGCAVVPRQCSADVCLPGNTLEIDTHFTGRGSAADRVQIQVGLALLADVDAPIIREPLQVPRVELPPDMARTERNRWRWGRLTLVSLGGAVAVIVAAFLWPDPAMEASDSAAVADVSGAVETQRAPVPAVVEGYVVFPTARASVESGVETQSSERSVSQATARDESVALRKPSSDSVALTEADSERKRDVVSVDDGSGGRSIAQLNVPSDAADTATVTEAREDRAPEHAQVATSTPPTSADPTSDVAESLYSVTPIRTPPQSRRPFSGPVRTTSERDLVAAQQALAQGQLMSPPGASAYELFSRVLTIDPESEPARQGLQSVREGLVNRAFAQLAANAWSEALVTLEDAHEAGADSLFINGLKEEAEYGLRRDAALAGNFDGLHPAHQLVAIRREPPRLRRFRSEMSEPLTVEFTLTELGRPSNIDIVGTPSDALAREVRRAVAGWQFEPVLYNGRPLPVRTSVQLAVRR